MKNHFIVFFCYIFSLCGYCFAERYIVPTRYDGQEEVIVQGSTIIVSQKVNGVSIYQTCETLDKNRANFYFTLLNNSNRPIQFYFSNLTITDQSGRPIKLKHKNELIAAKKNQRNWQTFASIMCTASESMSAQNAGTVNYQSTTNSSYHSNFNTYGSRGQLSGSANGYSTSTTQGTIHCEALRQQALRNVEINSNNRNQLIQSNYKRWEEGLNDFYFDSTTLFPGVEYSANFQIEVPSELEKGLQYLLFTFDMETETHTFCFYCGEQVKKWYHF